MTDCRRPVSLSLRRLIAADSPVFTAMIRDAWYAEHPGPCGLLMASIDWESCLAGATEALVAADEETGSPLGVILVRVARLDRRPLLNRHRRRAMRDGARLVAAPGGLRGFLELNAIGAIDRLLLREAVHARGDRPYPAEIVLFLVSPEARGRGVGGRLFRAAMAYLRGQGVSDYFLFTDTGCDVGFYEHQGLTRMAARDLTEPGASRAETFYVYEGRVPAAAAARRIGASSGTTGGVPVAVLGGTGLPRPALVVGDGTEDAAGVARGDDV